MHILCTLTLHAPFPQGSNDRELYAVKCRDIVLSFGVRAALVPSWLLYSSSTPWEYPLVGWLLAGCCLDPWSCVWALGNRLRFGWSRVASAGRQAVCSIQIRGARCLGCSGCVLRVWCRSESVRWRFLSALCYRCWRSVLCRCCGRGARCVWEIFGFSGSSSDFH